MINYIRFNPLVIMMTVYKITTESGVHLEICQTIPEMSSADINNFVTSTYRVHNTINDKIVYVDFRNKKYRDGTFTMPSSIEVKDSKMNTLCKFHYTDLNINVIPFMFEETFSDDIRIAIRKCATEIIKNL